MKISGFALSKYHSSISNIEYQISKTVLKIQVWDGTSSQSSWAGARSPHLHHRRRHGTDQGLKLQQIFANISATNICKYNRYKYLQIFPQQIFAKISATGQDH